MVLRSGYLAMALALQEAAEKSPDTFKAKLEAAIAAETEDSPWKKFLEAGARHSASDMGHLQAIHDASMVLGASCGGMQEAAKPGDGGLKLVESVAFPVDIELREACTPGTKIKLISPGKGSSAWYTEAALKQAATAKIFHAGLPMRIDHPTRADLAARPEGSVKDWGAVLGTDAEWLESYIGKDGKDAGKGLYSDIKPFSDHAATITEKGPFAGVSIMANGNALTEAGKPVMRDGVPVLKEFTSAEGADMVTRAGAGGMFLSESARAAEIPTQEAAMTADETKKLIEAAVAPYQQRLLRSDAREEATRLLEGVALPAVAKSKIVERATANVPVNADGGLDVTKFRESVVAEAKAEGDYLSALNPGGRVFGMGLPSQLAVVPKPEEIAAREAKAKNEEEDLIKTFESLGMTRTGAEFAAKGRVA